MAEAEVAMAAVVAAADAATAANGADVKRGSPRRIFEKRLGGQPRRFFDGLRAGSERRQEVKTRQGSLRKTSSCVQRLLRPLRAVLLPNWRPTLPPAARRKECSGNKSLPSPPAG